MREKIGKFVTGSMLSYLVVVVIVIIGAIMLNYAGVINLSEAYLWF
jgi:hypothetical protein